MHNLFPDTQQNPEVNPDRIFPVLHLKKNVRSDALSRHTCGAFFMRSLAILGRGHNEVTHRVGVDVKTSVLVVVF